MVLNIAVFSVIAAVFSGLLIPLIIKFCKAYSLYDSVNARKIHSGNIPRLGGIAIAIAFFAVAALFLLFNRTMAFRNVLPLLTAGMLIFLFGVIDDIVEMRAIHKLFIQLIASAIVVCSGYHFRQIFGLLLPIWVARVFTFFWIVGIINAYNLIDGLDGLCGTLVVTALITFGVILYGKFSEGTAICFILVGSIVGFLVWNFPAPNAKIFMGDNGSQFLGFLIATIPLYSITEDIEFNKLPMLLVIVAFPMMDTIAAIWRRLRDHRPIMSPDRFHLHHKLLNIGFNKRQVLLIIVLIQCEICLNVWISTCFGKSVAVVLLSVSYIFMVGFFTVIHYANRAVLRKIRLENEQRNSGETPSL